MVRTMLSLGLVAALALPAAADSPLVLFPPAPGTPVHVRLVHTTQTTHGLDSTTSVFTLTRKSATTAVIERTNPDGTPNLSVLTVAADGTLTAAAVAPFRAVRATRAPPGGRLPTVAAG